MSRSSRLLVTALVALLGLLGSATPARAASDAEAAASAARWVAAQATTITEPSVAADALLALAAGGDGSTSDEAATLLELLRTQGATYAASSPEAAAKLAIALEAVGEDPRTFLGDTDLIAAVEAGIGADGAFGSYPGPFASGLGMTALSRAGADVPDAMVTHLLTFVNADGGFGWGAEPSDADASALGLLGLLAANSSDAQAARAGVEAWAAANQAPDGSWSGFNTVNSTAVMASSLETAGVSQDTALAFLVGQQQPSGAFLSGDADDLTATTQAALMLAGVSYADVFWGFGGPADAEGVDATATPEPAAATASPAATHRPAETAAQAADAADALDPAAASGTVVAAILGAVAVLVAVGALWLRASPRRTAR